MAGPQDDPALPGALARLAAALAWPILADPLSLVRCGPHDRSHVLARGDQLLRPGTWRDAHLPDVVLRFGAMPTSKPFLALLEERRPTLLVVDGDGGWREPAIVPATLVHADATGTARALADALAPATAARAAAGSGRLRRAAAAGWTAGLPRTTPPTGRCATGSPASRTPARRSRAPRSPLLGDLLPDGAVLWASSSMPVRDLDGWLPAGPRAIRPLANRGANGIDGVVSSALGAAAAGARVVLVIGDLALLHDLSGLVAARLHDLEATIVVINNDGGGIFSFLPQATAAMPGAGLPGHFEELFGTPHGIDLGPAGRGPRRRAPGRGGGRAAPGARCRPASPGPPGAGAPQRQVAQRDPPPRGGGRRPGRPRRAGGRGRPGPGEGGPVSERLRMRIEGMTWTVRVAGQGRPVLFLHGFSGSGLSWAGLAGLGSRCRAIVPDLPGHGGTAWDADSPPAPAAADVPRPAGRRAADRSRRCPTAAAGVRRADGRRPRDDRPRDWAPTASTSSATRSAPGSPSGSPIVHPDAVRTPGPRGAVRRDRRTRAARAERAAADAERARLAVTEGIDAFAARWEAEPVLAGEAALPGAARGRQAAIRRANTPLGLAASLVYGGQGAMEPLHERLAEVVAPTLVVVGADDPVRARGEEVAAGIPGARLALVPGAGHAPHLERPERFHALLLEFLTETAA